MLKFLNIKKYEECPWTAAAAVRTKNPKSPEDDLFYKRNISDSITSERYHICVCIICEEFWERTWPMDHTHSHVHKQNKSYRIIFHIWNTFNVILCKGNLLLLYVYMYLCLFRSLSVCLSVVIKYLLSINMSFLLYINAVRT